MEFKIVKSFFNEQYLIKGHGGATVECVNDTAIINN